MAAAVPRVRLRSAAVWLPLAALVAASTVVHGLVALTTEAPWILPDELIYSELAKSLAAGDAPAVRGVESWGYGLVYPVLMAPAWAIFDAVPDAYAAARLLNALLLSLTAVPVYLLAQRFVASRLALGVAALAVAVPSTVYAGLLMTENAFYLVFALAVLAIARALERPTAARQLTALAAVGLAIATRSQAVALVAAYVTAALVHRWLERRAGGPRASFVAAHGVALGGLALVTAAFVVVQLVRGGSPIAFLGAYRTVATSIDWTALPAWLGIHLADLSLYVAVVPAAAAVVMAALGFRRGADARLRLYGALVPALVLWTTLLVAGFATEVDAERAAAYPSESMHVFERSVFPLVPLLLLGFALWLERGLPRPRRTALAAALLCGLAPAAIPFGRISDNLNFQAPGLVPWEILLPGGLARAAVLLAVGLALAAVFLRVERRRGHLWLLVVASFAFAYLLAAGSIRNSSVWAREAASGDDPAWIDRAVDRGSEVAVVWYEPGGAEFAPSRRSQRLVWVNEFFNRSVGTVYALGARLPYGLPDTRVRAARDGTLVPRSGGGPIRAEYVLARCAGQIRGRVAARDEESGAVLVRTGGLVLVGPAGAECG